MVSLHIESKMKVGPGFFVMHGDGTFVNAKSIGENCRIWQQVTIGIEGTDSPTIGNNVTIYAGAKIVGKVRVGDNVTIAANSLVIRDVPSNVTVIGVPAVVVWKKQGSRIRSHRSRKPDDTLPPLSRITNFRGRLCGAFLRLGHVISGAPSGKA